MTNNTRQINATGFIAMSSLRKVGEGSSLTTGTVQPASSRRERDCSRPSASPAACAWTRYQTSTAGMITWQMPK